MINVRESKAWLTTGNIGDTFSGVEPEVTFIEPEFRGHHTLSVALSLRSAV